MYVEDSSSSFAVVIMVVVLLIMVDLACAHDGDAWDVSYTWVDLDAIHVLIQVFQDYIRGNADEDELEAFHIADKAGNMFVVVVVVVAAVAAVRKQEHLFHDHMDMNLRVHNNLYFQKNHYKVFFCIKNLYLSSPLDE